MSQSRPAAIDPNGAAPLSPQAQLFSLSTSHFIPRSICLATELGIPDLLAEGPRHTEDLARATNTNAPALGRILRLAASVGVFTESEPMTFGLTPLGDALRSDVPGSMRAWIRMAASPMWYRALADASYSLETGQPCFEHALGATFFDYLARHDDLSAIFNRAMDDHGRGVSQAVVEAYDFTSVSRIVDVGGGHGTLIEAILKAYPTMTGVLFDAPHVADSARQIIATAGLSARCTVEGGDFFHSVPAGADAYLLRWIIHDWEPDRALTILRNCARAMNESGRILLVEALLPPGDEPHPSKVLDVAMLTGLGGQERTRDEYEAFLDEANLRLSRVVPTASPMSILEAVRR